MLVEQSSKFNQLDFVVLLLQMLKERNVKSFNKGELEKILYYYKLNNKYELLFSDFKILNRKVDLEEVIKILNLIGAIKPSEINSNKFYIIMKKEEYYNDIIYNQEIIKEMNKLINEYVMKNEIENKNNRLKIYSINPNDYNNYILVSGKHKGKSIEWNLITDATHYFNIINKKKYNGISISNPSENDNMIIVNNYELSKITLRDATYAMLQGNVNGSLETSILYTECTDIDRLEEIIDCCEKVNKLKIKSRIL